MATSRIFIKGLPPSITEAEVRKHFSSGNRDITDVKLIPQRRIGYIGYKDAEDAAKAVKYFNRTFVRMSRISVEPAKAISDPTLNKRQRHGNTGPAGAATKRSRPEEGDAAAAAAAGAAGDAVDGAVSKKRRTDNDDPKLREYLRVMGSGREANQVLGGAVDVGPATGGDDETWDPKGNLPPEGDSDDEYEQIPSKEAKAKAKADRAAAAAAPPAAAPQTGAAAVAPAVDHQPATAAAGDHEDQDMVNQDETVTAADETAATASAAPAAAADDDDWLRSRTSRLLDLVDPDDLPPAPAPQPTAAPAAPAAAGAAQPPPDPATNSESAADKAVAVGQATVDGGGDGPVANDEAQAQVQAQPAEPTRDMTTVEAIQHTRRLFVRNLPYGASEDEIRDSFGKFGSIEEVHIPVSKSGTSKGFALVLFEDASGAVDAFQSMDGTTFQGRILHIIPASAKRDSGLDEYELSKLPLKKQNLIRKRQEAASSTFNWNSLYMNQDAVNASVASRLGVSKSELLDPTSADAAVKQAVAETTVIQETKAYFVANGVDLEAFKSAKRGDTAILVKNFPHGTTLEELRTLFEQAAAGGPILRVLMPPSGTIAIVQFAQANDAKTAFGKLAYRRIKDSVLFLEKAPKDLLVNAGGLVGAGQSGKAGNAAQKLTVDDMRDGAADHDADEDEVIDTTSLFVRNLSFDTTTDGLAQAFRPLEGFVSAHVKTKRDPKRPGQTLSMGFGFVEFRGKPQASAALKAMDGHVLDGHALAVKASHRGLDAVEERKRAEALAKKKGAAGAGQRTKLIVKNLPFQTTKRDIQQLFGTYGQLRSVRVPKKADHTARGFAFADFVTAREAENALTSLRDTHLLGRKLVIDYAEAEAADAEEEIDKMQRKVGGQVNKMALQQLTGRGRQKVTIGDEEEE